MNLKNLTKMFFSWKNGNITKEKFTEAISMYVYKYPLMAYRWNQDDCSDFFSYFYPKISRMIESFQFRNIPFEIYLSKTLKFQMRTFVKNKLRTDLTREVFKNKEFWSYINIENYSYSIENEIKWTAADSPENYSAIPKVLEEIIKQGADSIGRDTTMKKRILMLILQNVETINENEVEVISNLIECEKEWLHNTLEKLREKLYRRAEVKENLEQRRNKLFCTLYKLHQHCFATIVAEEKKNLAVKIENIKERIEKLTKKITKMRGRPTHKEIAVMLQIPKGSVDSGLFYLKLYLEKQREKMEKSNN